MLSFNNINVTLLGPFSQILTLRNLPLKGGLQDDQLEVINNGGLIIDKGKILVIDDYKTLSNQYSNVFHEIMEDPMVLMPGFIDSHTHICFWGNRSNDYAMRNSGRSYLEIAKAGGGIWSSVQMTRDASKEELLNMLLKRIDRHTKEGVTTIEIKSGYGLDVETELKMLRVIQQAKSITKANIVPTCLAAHIKPKDYNGNERDYLEHIMEELLPIIKQEGLCSRVDIFIEDTAFSINASQIFLQNAAKLGFDITVHADQFTVGGSKVAVECNAMSADHLEASGDEEIKLLAKSNTVATVLPGASLGLGMQFAPARKLLNAGCCVSIASDWNPGSAPQGDLLIQAAVLGAYEKLSAAEIFSGLTFRAANALRLKKVGTIDVGMKADLQAFPTKDYKNILYNQGKLKATKVWINGVLV